MLSQPYAVPTSYDGRLWEHWAPHAKAGILPGVKRGFGFGIRTQAQQHRYGVAGFFYFLAKVPGEIRPHYAIREYFIAGIKRSRSQQVQIAFRCNLEIERTTVLSDALR